VTQNSKGTFIAVPRFHIPVINQPFFYERKEWIDVSTLASYLRVSGADGKSRRPDTQERIDLEKMLANKLTESYQQFAALQVQQLNRVARN
jgi:hypothetical protein